MPSIRAPRIVIYEFFKAVAAAIGPTSLPSCIIGPLYKLFKNKFLANYNNDPVIIDLDLGTGYDFDFDYTKFRIANFTSTNELPLTLKSISGASLTSATKTITFTTTPLVPLRKGDWVQITDPILLRGFYKIDKVVITEAGVHTIYLNTTASLFDATVDIKILYLYPERSGTVYTIPGYITIDDLYVNKIANLNSPNKTTIELSSNDIVSVNDIVNIYATSSPNLPVGSYKVVAVDYSVATPVITIDHVNTGASVTVSFNVTMGNTIPTGKLYADYRGLDTTQTDIIEISDSSEITEKFGEDAIDIDNPLAYGMYFNLLASTVGVKAFAIPSNDEAGYDFHTNLWDKRDIYVIVPLTYSSVVKSSYKTKIESLNDPQKGKILRSIFAEKVSKYLSIYTGSKSDLVSSGNALVSGTSTFDINFDATSSIPWGQITINADKINITKSDVGYSSLNGEYLIVAKDIGNKKLTVQGKLGTDIPAGSVITFDFEILHLSANSEIAEKLANDGELLFNRAHSQIIGNVYTVIDGEEKEIDTYYAAAGLAGLCSSLPPQQQFNGFNIPGITKVKDTWDLFNDDQLSLIAGGGNILLIQDGPGTTPYIRNQLTTDVTSVLTRSLNISRCVDYTKKLLYSEIKLFLTGYNAIPTTAELITFRVNSILSFLKRFTVPKAGSVILSGRVTKVEIVENAIIVDINAVYPRPLEEIDFNLYVE